MKKISTVAVKQNRSFFRADLRTDDSGVVRISINHHTQQQDGGTKEPQKQHAIEHFDPPGFGVSTILTVSESA
jgi:hypothetical protein